ncbi:hypothetical protein LQR30_10320 [Chromobacterium piscinae]|uniref:antiviral reverse transcriptase Drt2 n=1 Tax=Chromobacterium piscinae TaxID=686831 RepID=UPI001E491D8C|nr:antiviral reverse transcriptase Drt2 [Chromobacterium piscinae]MCD4504501.1 hypothetical protein [Chromobacterium piscinae]
MKIHPWFKFRGYAHFDLPISLANAEKIVTCPEKITQHSFYPFLRYTVTTQKVEKDSTGLARPKKPKSRPISFASHLDSHIYSYYAAHLSQLYEKILIKEAIHESVLAFRPLGKSNIDFANMAFETIKEIGECVAFATDIIGFFDNLHHTTLKKAWAYVLDKNVLPPDHYAVFKSLTNYSYVIKEDAFEKLGLSISNPPSARNRICTSKEFRDLIRENGLIYQNKENRGIPQGSPISSLLSNLYLLEFDKKLQTEITSRNGYYFRYCDDILCIVPNSHSGGIFEIVENLIKKYGLDINEMKTETSIFSKQQGQLISNRPLQYLGFTFDGKRKLIRSAAFAKFSEKMRKGVSLAKLTARKHNKLRFTHHKPIEGVWRNLIYERYSHLGKRNFIRYGLRAAKIMNAPEINQQLKPLWSRLARRIEDADSELIVDHTLIL